MAIQYSAVGARVLSTFAATDAGTILDGIHSALVSAGWTDMTRFRAHNKFINLPFFSGPFDGEHAKIGPTTYTFQTIAGACPIVQIDASPAVTYNRWSTQINTCDPNFVSPYGGNFGPPTDPTDGAGVLILARDVGTQFNNLTLSIDSFNTGAWDKPVTSGGGWELESAATPTAGLKLRVQLVGEYIPGPGIVPNIYITTTQEDVRGGPFRLAMGGFTYQVLASPYQFFISATGSAANNASVCAGVPYVPTFQQPIAITAANIGTTPIQCTTATPHGLTTGQIVSILEATETTSVTGSGTSAANNTLGALTISAINDFQDGDVVKLATGGGSPSSDGFYVIRNVTPSGFTLENSLGLGGLGGIVIGPAHSLNKIWHVTVVDATHFTLDGSTAVSINFNYNASTGILGAPGKLNRMIWSTGSDGSSHFRNSLKSDSNSQFIAVGTSSYGFLSSGDQAAPRFVMAGLLAAPLNYSNGCAVLHEPLLALGADGAGSQAYIVGQVWDAALIASTASLDLQKTLDGHTIQLFGQQNGDFINYQGSLWIAVT